MQGFHFTETPDLLGKQAGVLRPRDGELSLYLDQLGPHRVDDGLLLGDDPSESQEIDCSEIGERPKAFVCRIHFLRFVATFRSFSPPT